MTNTEKELTTYFRQRNNLKTQTYLTMGELSYYNQNIKHITDTTIFYNGNFYKLEQRFSKRKINLCYELLDITAKQFDMNELRNSTNKFTQFCYNTDILPRLQKMGLAEI